MTGGILLALVVAQSSSGLPGDVVVPGSSPPPPLEARLRSVPLLVIDPGHGGEDPGVQPQVGPPEKELALSLARRLQAKLDTRTRVLLTRLGDTAMPTTDRASFSNQAKATLFVSLHAGSSLSPQAKGFAVYYHDPSGASAEAAGNPGSTLRAIPWSAAQVAVEGQSAELASLVHDALVEKVPLADRGVRRLPLATLEGVTCPAVEVDLGLLSNAEDALALASDALQELIASALSEAVEKMDGVMGAAEP